VAFAVSRDGGAGCQWQFALSIGANGFGKSQVATRSTVLERARERQPHNPAVAGSQPARSTCFRQIKIRLPQGYRESQGRWALAFFASTPSSAMSWRFGVGARLSISRGSAIWANRTAAPQSG